jgi:hypothetical protein
MQKDAGISIETDLFEHTEVKPDFINRCCFGEDFARWLKARLAAASEFGLELSEPIQEDYGWGLWARAGRDRCWIAIAYMGEGAQNEPAQWNVSADPAGGLLGGLFGKSRTLAAQLRTRLREILAAEPAIAILD